MSDSISPSITCALLILASRAIGLPLRVCVRVSVCACVCACMCMRACVCVCFSTSLTNTFAFIPLSPHISDFLATFLWQPSPPPCVVPSQALPTIPLPLCRYLPLRRPRPKHRLPSIQLGRRNRRSSIRSRSLRLNGSGSESTPPGAYLYAIR